LKNKFILFLNKTLGSKFERPEQSTSHSNQPLYLSNDISSILLDETWWQSLLELVKLLKPYCIIWILCNQIS